MRASERLQSQVEQRANHGSPATAAGDSWADAPTRPHRRVRRRIGTVLLVLGTLLLLYGAAVYFWRDPVTDLWARWKQHGLTEALDREFAEFAPDLPAPAVPAATEAAPTTSAPPTSAQTDAAPPGNSAVHNEAGALAADARSYLRTLEPGQPIGRLQIDKLGIGPVIVNGTEWGRDLSRGPGRYPETQVPGLDGVTAIAGHRTTFGAWFRHIDRLAAGDEIVVRMPYGTFYYRVTSHEIVDSHDWSIIQPRGYDMLVLSACHPLYSASQRWVVFAKLDRVEARDGSSFAVPQGILGDI